MTGAPIYPGSDTRIRVGDAILWHGYDPGTVVFVMSSDEWRVDFAEQKEWFLQEYEKGIMIETKGGGMVLESEDDPHLTLVKSVGGSQ